MEHQHSFIVTSGPWPVRPEPQDEEDRHRYVMNIGCQVCHDRHETAFSTTGDGDDTPRLLAELIEKTFDLRFATESELAAYHAEK
jgi:hypothetical protein